MAIHLLDFLLPVRLLGAEPYFATPMTRRNPMPGMISDPISARGLRAAASEAKTRCFD